MKKTIMIAMLAAMPVSVYSESQVDPLTKVTCVYYSFGPVSCTKCTEEPG